MTLKVTLNDFLCTVSFCFIIAKVIFMNLDQKKRITSTNSSTAILPDDLIVEILLRLDAKSLTRFKCVCKYWKSLLSDSVFVNMHHKRQVPYAIFAHSVKPSEILSIRRTENFHKISKLRFPVADFKSIEGSDNGILCLSGDKDTVYLWNPAINQVRKLPSPPISRFRLGFGYNPRTNDFKVVAVGGPAVTFLIKDHPFNAMQNLFARGNEVAIYSLGSNAWKTRKMPHIFNSEDIFFPTSHKLWSSLVVSRCIHWMCEYRTYNNENEQEQDRFKILCFGIVSFDLDTEQFKLLDIPKPVEARVHNIGKLSERLALYAFQGFTRLEHYPVFQIWVMKEYGISISWIKYLKITLSCSSAIKDTFTNFSSNGDIGFTSDGYVLISTAMGLHLCDLENNTAQHLCRQTITWLTYFPDYVESMFQIKK